MYAVEVTWQPNGTTGDLPRVQVYPTNDPTEQRDILERRIVFADQAAAEDCAASYGWQAGVDPWVWQPTDPTEGLVVPRRILEQLVSFPNAEWMPCPCCQEAMDAHAPGCAILWIQERLKETA